MARAQRSNGPVVDIHCHRECAPAAAMMRDAARAAGKVAVGHGDVLTRAVNQRQLEMIRPKMDSFDVRLADMDRMGVDVQAVSVAVYQYYYWADAELGAKAARMINEEFAQATARYDGRFVPLGTVPLQDTDAAVEELRHLAGPLGMRGIEIGTYVSGPDISDPEISSPRLDPFWAEVERLGLVVVVHTEGSLHPRRMQGHNFVNIVGHAFEATLAIGHLIFAGVVARHPDLKIVVVHGGGYLPAYAGRIDHGWRARDDVREGVAEPPTSYLRKFYFDTMVFEPGQVRYLVDTYGAEHVLLGSDYPYDMGDDDPLALLAATGIPQEQVDLIAGGNAARLLGGIG